MRNEIRSCGLILSLLVMVAAAELTTDAVAGTVPQTASFINTTPLLPSRDRHPLMIVRLYNYALPSQAEITGESQRFPLARHFVCDKGYTLKQCDEELVVLKKALAKYPISDLGEWTWVLVRSEYWELTLLTQRLDPGIPALTDTAARATFFDDALVTGASGRLSELMTVWHMGRESLLDFAIRHELGHALCNNANEMDADRVARLLKQKKPISCKAKVGANPHQQPTKSSYPQSTSTLTAQPTIGQPVTIGFFDHAPVIFEQQHPTVEGALEHDPAFKESARKAWEEVGYGDLPQEAGFMVSRAGNASPVQLGKEIGSTETVGSTTFKIPSGGVFAILHTHPRPSRGKPWLQQPSQPDMDVAKNFKLNVYVVTASGLWLAEPDGNLVRVFTNNDWMNKKKK
jgi:hypothetical protein